jgi:hypothetical protein
MVIANQEPYLQALRNAVELFVVWIVQLLVSLVNNLYADLIEENAKCILGVTI